MSSSDHPLGDINGPEAVPEVSIVDTVFNLDELASANVRRAEKVARFSVRPDIEADIEELDAELNLLTDSQGRPNSEDDDPAIAAASGRSARIVALELQAKQREYGESMKTVRFRAMSDDDWSALQVKYRDALENQPPYPATFYEDIIVQSAIVPKFTAESVRKFRSMMGAPAFEVLFRASWNVNTQSGVSIPKSLLSSLVLRQSQSG